ncbi:hypothetical protein GUJ93_ZPchr0008g13979 [Zizania palustris]|uniref:GH16 domain-containing protein n=1 Tax=Zizania palustris TaxID=103762 RepID=A0A8J5R5S6_ZIZPA|nr:hypothetical protein GUJ93_ZPchr0008g13979 [Zizania palustris]
MTDSIDMLWGNTQVLYDSTGHQSVSLPWPVDDFCISLKEILVDGTPIQQMKIQLRNDIDQPMRPYASIWNADDWATQGGRVKTDWFQALFKAFFRNYRANTYVPYKTAWISSQGSSESS